jgi:hypothetical protein
LKFDNPDLFFLAGRKLRVDHQFAAASKSGHNRTAPACVLCFVSDLLLAALMAVTGVLNHSATATCAMAGISSSTEGHPRRSKIPLDFGVSSGPSTLNREIEICQVREKVGQIKGRRGSTSARKRCRRASRLSPTKTPLSCHLPVLPP